ncbi:NACHT domain-containing protein [Actinokineospora sp. NPDC004072]
MLLGVEHVFGGGQEDVGLGIHADAREDHGVNHVEVSGDMAGSIMQVGTLVGAVHLSGEPSQLRSSYLAQVRALAPDALEGRDEELAELADFCTSASPAAEYLWVRGPAWSGKTALLSWFVLNPPPGVRIVSFFVTSRMPGHSTRRGCVDNLLEQLWETSSGHPRAELYESTRETWLLQLLADAAEAHLAQGERLVLVVDGLDEDRGFDLSPDAHSIAALLPRRGIRVIVACRPDPGLPVDVAREHPLRTSALVKNLEPSPKAVAVRDVMIKDLKRLLKGTDLQRALLGFITASGGGLSVRDLAELTKASEWDVEEELTNGSGRSFSQRPGDPPSYVLAHDQLRELAVEMLGHELPRYLERIITWADGYRDRGWPPNTPHHLLQGFTPMLVAAGYRDRVIDHVTDPRRHDASYAAFASHHLSIHEIEIVTEMLLGDDEPDLSALARLAVHRVALGERGSWITPWLPWAWARVGRFDHAEALTTAMPNTIWRAREHLHIGSELHTAGQTDRARHMFDFAESVSRSVNQTFDIGLHLEVATEMTRTGDYERAQRVIDTLRPGLEKAATYAKIALISLELGNQEQAHKWYAEAEQEFESQDRRSMRAIGAMAAAASKLGNETRAAAVVGLFADPDRTYSSSSVGDIYDCVTNLTAGGFVEAAISLAEAREDAEQRDFCYIRLIENLALNGRLDDAETLARSTKNENSMLARLSAVATVPSDPIRLARLASELEPFLDRIPEGPLRRYATGATAVAFARSGELGKAEDLVHSALLPTAIHSATWVALVMANVDRNRSATLLEKIESSARSASSTPSESGLLNWIDVAADFEDFDRAEKLALSLRDPERWTAAWSRIAERLASAGDYPRFRSAISRVTRESQQRIPRLEMIRVLLARNEVDLALEVARSSPTIWHRAAAISLIAERTQRKDLLDESVGLANGISDLEDQAKTLLPALRAAANMADRSTTETIRSRVQQISRELRTQDKGRHHSIPHLPDRVSTMAEIAEYLERFTPTDGPGGPGPIERSGIPPVLLGRSDSSKAKQYAKALTMMDWKELVDRIVVFAPEVYGAIASELDRLNSKGTSSRES